LVPGGIKLGTIFAVEYDPESQWFAIATTIAADVLKNGGSIACFAVARSPEDVENDLSSLGVDVESAFKGGRLQINDHYTASLSGGRIEPFHPGVVSEDSVKGTKWLSFKVQDLSVEFLKDSRATRMFRATWPSGTLNVMDSYSDLLRFNDEKSSADYLTGRLYPTVRQKKRILLLPFVRGIHTDWFYKRVESISDGVIDVQLREHEEETKSFLRIRSLKGQPHDSRWHEIEVKPNGEAVIVG
jgi:KaiC/GvpD/RAD55 family RecA-like ATPase